MMKDARPTNITADRQSNQLTIKWGDGHTSLYSFSLVRLACPCAECRGGHDNMRSDPDPEVFSQLQEDSPRSRMVKIEPVGTYALTIEWQDGHHYGIYNWNYLRKMCPCSECRGNESHVGA